MKLFKEDGKIANFEDIAEFMVETYPPDIFIEGQNPIQKRIFQIRDACQKLLEALEEFRKQKEVEQD
jgi:hypothetical protein